jgi:hypothetical protein
MSREEAGIILLVVFGVVLSGTLLLLFRVLIIQVRGAKCLQSKESKKIRVLGKILLNVFMILLVLILLVFTIVAFAFPHVRIPGYCDLIGGIGLIMCWTFLASVVVGLGQVVGRSNYQAGGLFRELFRMISKKDGNSNKTVK